MFCKAAHSCHVLNPSCGTNSLAYLVPKNLKVSCCTYGVQQTRVEMPTVLLHPPSPSRRLDSSRVSNPLPQLLQTPSGLALLEIQGTINMPPINPNIESTGLAENISIGRLVFPYQSPNDFSETWMKRVYLYIGRHQRMTGEVKKLPKPLAVVRRVAKNGQDVADEEEELEIAEIVYHRIIFSNRPEPVSG